MMPWNQVRGNPPMNSMGQGPNPLMGGFGMNPAYQMPPQMAYQQPYMHQPMYQQAMNTFNNHRMNSMMPQQPALPPTQPLPPTPSMPPTPSLPPTPAGPPPAAENAPPPPPSDDAKTSIIPPPPDSKEQWWRAELNSIHGATREELSRLTQAEWFLTMSTSQQIECWQHKMQLKSKQESKSQRDAATSNPHRETGQAEPAKMSVEANKEPVKDLAPEWSESSGENPGEALQHYQEQLESLKKQGTVFEKQYTEWRGQFDAWKAKHENHPNKTQFQQYEKQWMTWQEQMLGQKRQNEANMERLATNIKKIEQVLAAPPQPVHQQQLHPYSQPTPQPRHQFDMQPQNHNQGQNPAGMNQQFNRNFQAITGSGETPLQNQQHNGPSASFSNARQESEGNFPNTFSDSHQHHHGDEHQPSHDSSWQQKGRGEQAFQPRNEAPPHGPTENYGQQLSRPHAQPFQQQHWGAFEGNDQGEEKLGNVSNQHSPVRPSLNQPMPRFGDRPMQRPRFLGPQQQRPRFPNAPQLQRHRFPPTADPPQHGNKQTGDAAEGGAVHHGYESRMVRPQSFEPRRPPPSRFTRPKVYNEQGIEEDVEPSEEPELYVDGEELSSYVERTQHVKPSFPAARDDNYSRQRETFKENRKMEVNDFGDSCVVIDDDVRDTSSRFGNRDRFDRYASAESGIPSRFQDSDLRSRDSGYDPPYHRQAEWSRGRVMENKPQSEKAYEPPHSDDQSTLPGEVDLQTAQQLAEKNPLFQGENLKKLQEQLRAITGSASNRDGDKVADATSTLPGRLDDEYNVLAKANTISSMDLKNILSAVRSATSSKDSALAARSSSGHTRQSYGNRGTTRGGADPLLDSLTSLAAVGALDDDLVLQEYLKLDPALEQELFLRAMQDKELLKEARQFAPSFEKQDLQNSGRRNSDKGADDDLGRDYVWPADDRLGREVRVDRPWEPPQQDYVYPPVTGDHQRGQSYDHPSVKDPSERSRDMSPFRDLRDADQRLQERESIEKRHSAINRDLASLQQRRHLLGEFYRGGLRSQDGDEEDERRRRERSLERLRMRENELHARERDLRAREEMLRDALRRSSPFRQQRHDDPMAVPPRHHDDRRSPRMNSNGGTPPRNIYHGFRPRGSPPRRPPNEFPFDRDFPPRFPGETERRRMSRSPPRRMSRSPPRRMSRSPPRRMSRSPPRRMSRSPPRRRSRSPQRGAPPRAYIERRPRGRDSPRRPSPPRRPRRSRSRSPPLRGKDEFGRDLSNRIAPRGRHSPPRNLPPRARDSSPRRRDQPRSQPPAEDRKYPPKERSEAPLPMLPVVNVKPTGKPLTFADVRTESPAPPAPLLVNVDDVINKPGRLKRPAKIAVILRGLPGCGKTHVAKMIRDKEAAFGVSPRLLGLDDYFMTEVEKVITDESGKKTKNKVLEYEYEEEMEASYRGNLIRSFKRTLEDGYFTFVIVDAVNNKVDHFKDCYDSARTAGFQVYIAEIHADDHVCARRNNHNRTLEEIQKLRSSWEETPAYMNKLDLRMMIQDGAIQEVEMGDITDSEDEPAQVEVKEESQEHEVARSKWENEVTQLDKLDGISKKPARKGMDDFLSVTDDYEKRQSAPGKKRVRWADIHERENQQRMRDVGFVVGQTDWSRMMDDRHATRALNKTKFI